jgi:hypothetical protein
MSDYFGNEQTRVLDVKDRNIDNVVFQYKHPPLTSEWNLINQVGNEKIQNLAKMSLPSGWLNVGEINQNASDADATTGSVNCSDSFIYATSFKLFSLNNNYAIVNGWPILVQGWGPGSTIEDNVIRLDDTPNQNNNFVFLEVWRKLVGTNDPIYAYGNINLPYSDNEIEWNVIGCETTKRVQIQYRIRSVKVSSLFDSTKEIFDTNPISPIGGRTSEAILQSFSKFGTSDPGLYVAGDGSDAQKDYLGTVDGYVYAIPMFIVYRRTLSDNEFISTTIDNSIVTKEMKTTGYRSDRPDNKIVDVIYKEDIVDLRHHVGVSGDLKNIVDSTIGKLVAGELTTALKKGFGEDGAITNAYSGGSILMKVERVNSASGDNIPDIGFGSDTPESIFKRRAFCNAEIIHDHNIIEITNSGIAWSPETFTIASRVILPPGNILTVDGFYSPDQGLVTGVSSAGGTITVSSSSSLLGTNDRLFMEFTFKYNSSSYGFKDVPREFIEVNKNDDVIIATRDNDILLRYNNNGELLNFGASAGNPGYPGDINTGDKVHYCGGNYTELSNFGHELILNRTAINGIVNLSLSNYKYNLYPILGVKSVKVIDSYKDFSINISTSNCIITIGALLSTPSSTVELSLYTGSGYNPYSVTDSFKFFEMSKQGRGIIDTYEMLEILTDNKEGDYYIVDTGIKPIIKIATQISTTGGGIPFYINSSGNSVLLSPTINNSIPVLDETSYTAECLPTRIKIHLPGITGQIRVPLIVHSYVTLNESSYNFYYKTIPYQGLLNTTSDSIHGKVIGESSAFITSSGSGAIVNYAYKGDVSDTAAEFIGISNTVFGVGTLWKSYVNTGDYIRKTDTSKYYRIKDIVTDTEITLFEQFLGVSEITQNYEIVRLDIPGSVISNIVERLPTLSVISTDNITEYTCYSDTLMMGNDQGDVLFTSAKIKLQDPLNSFTNDFTLGSGTVAKRGRKDFQLTAGGNTVFKIGNGRPYIIYPNTSELPAGHNKKVYQFYLFMRSGKGYYTIIDPVGVTSDIMGRVYLMVVAGETVDSARNYLNPFSGTDVVDIYELIGRPIVRG